LLDNEIIIGEGETGRTTVGLFVSDDGFELDIVTGVDVVKIDVGHVDGCENRVGSSDELGKLLGDDFNVDVCVGRVERHHELVDGFSELRVGH